WRRRCLAASPARRDRLEGGGPRDLVVLAAEPGQRARVAVEHRDGVGAQPFPGSFLGPAQFIGDVRHADPVLRAHAASSSVLLALLPDPRLTTPGIGERLVEFPFDRREDRLLDALV